MTRQAVRNWQQRYDNFPKPIQSPHTGPVWDREVVERWVKNQYSPTHVVSFINRPGGAAHDEKSAPFDPKKLDDHYGSALNELVAEKMIGHIIVAKQTERPAAN